MWLLGNDSNTIKSKSNLLEQHVPLLKQFGGENSY